MLSKKDVYVIKRRKDAQCDITVIHKLTGLRVETLASPWSQSEEEAIASATALLTEDVSEHYRS